MKKVIKGIEIIRVSYLNGLGTTMFVLGKNVTTGALNVYVSGFETLGGGEDIDIAWVISNGAKLSLDDFVGFIGTFLS